MVCSLRRCFVFQRDLYHVSFFFFGLMFETWDFEERGEKALYYLTCSFFFCFSLILNSVKKKKKGKVHTYAYTVSYLKVFKSPDSLSFSSFVYLETRQLLLFSSQYYSSVA